MHTGERRVGSRARLLRRSSQERHRLDGSADRGGEQHHVLDQELADCGEERELESVCMVGSNQKKPAFAQGQRQSVSVAKPPESFQYFVESSARPVSRSRMASGALAG